MPNSYKIDSRQTTPAAVVIIETVATVSNVTFLDLEPWLHQKLGIPINTSQVYQKQPPPGEINDFLPRRWVATSYNMDFELRTPLNDL